MSEPKKVGDIEVDEDLSFSRKEWRWQRVGWVVMGLLIAAGLAGAFGRGPIARSKVGDPRVFAIDYHRIVRHSASDAVTIHIPAGLQADSVVQLAVSRNYLRDHEVEWIWPEPLEQTASGEFILFAFQREDPRYPLRIHMQLRPTSYWSSSGKVQLLGATALDISQFILP